MRTYHDDEKRVKTKERTKHVKSYSLMRQEELERQCEEFFISLDNEDMEGDFHEEDVSLERKFDVEEEVVSNESDPEVWVEETESLKDSSLNGSRKESAFAGMLLCSCETCLKEFQDYELDECLEEGQVVTLSGVDVKWDSDIQGLGEGLLIVLCFAIQDLKSCCDSCPAVTISTHKGKICNLLTPHFHYHMLVKLMVELVGVNVVISLLEWKNVVSSLKLQEQDVCYESLFEGVSLSSFGMTMVEGKLSCIRVCDILFLTEEPFRRINIEQPKYLYIQVLEVNVGMKCHVVCWDGVLEEHFQYHLNKVLGKCFQNYVVEMFEGKRLSEVAVIHRCSFANNNSSCKWGVESQLIVTVRMQLWDCMVLFMSWSLFEGDSSWERKIHIFFMEIPTRNCHGYVFKDASMGSPTLRGTVHGVVTVSELNDKITSDSESLQVQDKTIKFIREWPDFTELDMKKNEEDVVAMHVYCIMGDMNSIIEVRIPVVSNNQSLKLDAENFEKNTRDYFLRNSDGNELKHATDVGTAVLICGDLNLKSSIWKVENYGERINGKVLCPLHYGKINCKMKKFLSSCNKTHLMQLITGIISIDAKETELVMILKWELKMNPIFEFKSTWRCIVNTEGVVARASGNKTIKSKIEWMIAWEQQLSAEGEGKVSKNDDPELRAIPFQVGVVATGIIREQHESKT